MFKRCYWRGFTLYKQLRHPSYEQKEYSTASVGFGSGWVRSWGVVVVFVLLF